MKAITHFKLRNLLKKEFFELQSKETSIDLLKVLEREIISLGYQHNLYAIARYIYIRLGEIFQYDSKLIYGDSITKQKIRDKRINIRDIKNFNFVCDSFSYMYVDFLNHFGIKADIVDVKDHVYVVYIIDGKTYLADLTSGNEDITRIKFGLKPIYNRQIYPVAPKVDHTFDEIDEAIYVNGITTEEALEMVKNELKNLKIKHNWTNEEYVYQIFKLIENLMSFKRNSLGFVSGVTYIYHLLEFFVPNYVKNNAHFLNQENDLEMEVFSIIGRNNNYYFVFEKNENEVFSFYELSSSELQNKIQSKNISNIINQENLLIRKKQKL